MKLNSVQQASQEQFARQSHRYAKGHVLENVDDLREALDLLALPQKARVLDVATGAGHTAIFFAGLGHEVIAADIAAPMLDRVREAACKRDLSIPTQLHAAEKMPHADSTFDFVTCRVAAHHFSSPRDFVREVARVLKPGGVFLLIDGSVEDDHEEAEEWIHRVEKLRDPSHNRMLTPRAWTSLCEENGLFVQRAKLTPFKQPDLEWYFETAATSPENRAKVRELIDRAPASARELFQIGEEDGKTVWWWRRLMLVARKIPRD